MIRFTITLYLWWLWAYLAIGVALQPWMAWHYWRTTNNPDSFWMTVKRIRPKRLPASILLWPWAMWEHLR